MPNKKDLFNKKFFEEYTEQVNPGGTEAGSSPWSNLEANDVSLTLDLDPDKIKAASAAVKKAMQTLSSDSGIMNTDVPEPSINFIESPNSISIKSMNNRSGIVFGTDRPHTLESGFGAKGGSGANTIAIVAGRGASCHAAEKKAGIIGAGVADGVKRPPGSAVAIKADDARIIGRNGVKIVTGRSFAFRGAGMKGEKRASGGELSEVPAPAIELIAGNNTDDRKVFGGLKNPIETVNNLQGIARGDYTRDAIKEIAAMFEQVISCIDRLLWLQEAFNVMMGPSVWEPWRPPGSAMTVGAQMTMINSSIWNLRIDKILWEINYLYDFGYKYVVSQNVYST